MGNFEGIRTFTGVAGEDFAAGSLHELVAIDGGKIVKADGNHAEANRQWPVGILAVDAAKSGQAVTVVDLDAGGIAKVKTAGVVAQDGILIVSNTPGKADDVANVAALAANQVPFGIALEAAAAANQIISFKVGRFVGPTA